MIFLTLRNRTFILKLARGSFQDENVIPLYKKYHSLPHPFKNLYFITQSVIKVELCGKMGFERGGFNADIVMLKIH